MPPMDYSDIDKDKNKIIEKLQAEVVRLSHEIVQLQEDLVPVWSLVKEYKVIFIRLS